MDGGEQVLENQRQKGKAALTIQRQDGGEQARRPLILHTAEKCLFPRLCGGGEWTSGLQRSTPTQQGAHTHSHEHTYVQAERPPSRDTHARTHHKGNAFI